MTERNKAPTRAQKIAAASAAQFQQTALAAAFAAAQQPIQVTVTSTAVGNDSQTFTVTDVVEEIPAAETAPVVLATPEPVVVTDAEPVVEPVVVTEAEPVVEPVVVTEAEPVVVLVPAATPVAAVSSVFLGTVYKPSATFKRVHGFW